jgi:hypothetical protein
MSYIQVCPIIISWNSKYEPTANTSEYNCVFPTPIYLNRNKNYRVALSSFETYYSFPNITTKNNKFKYTNASGVTITLELPTGCYDVSTINSTISSMMGNDSGKISIDLIVPELKACIKIAQNFSVDFKLAGSINRLLGFSSKIIDAGITTADDIIKINDINSILINCDLITNSYVNGIQAPVIYSFFPNVPPGYKIIKELSRLEYVDINRNSEIKSIRIWLTDQDGDMVNFRGETVTIRLILSELVA